MAKIKIKSKFKLALYALLFSIATAITYFEYDREFKIAEESLLWSKTYGVIEQSEFIIEDGSQVLRVRYKFKINDQKHTSSKFSLAVIVT